MASPPASFSFSLAMITFQFVLLATCFCHILAASAGIGFRIGMSHVDSDKNLTKLQMVRRSFQRDMSRVNAIQQAQTFKSGFESFIISSQGRRPGDFHTQIMAGTGDYELTVSVGSPPVPFTAIMDTGSDLIWTQCMPCTSCMDQTGKKPIFDPSKSSTVANVTCVNPLCQALPPANRPLCTPNACEYKYSYGDSSSTAGFMATETFSFGGGAGAGAAASPAPSGSMEQQASFPNIGFGCGTNNRGTGLETGNGVLGLGRGPLSLVSQLGIKKFSYCLSPVGANKISNLLVGSESDPLGSGSDPKRTTRLLRSRMNPSFYYVSLEGITIGSYRLPIPQGTFDMGAEGSGGVMVDSGTSVTMISSDAYSMVRQSFIAQTRLQVAAGSGPPMDLDSVEKAAVGSGTGPDSNIAGLDLCFDLGGKTAAQVQFPNLIFHFTGMDWDLPQENYIVVDREGKTACLAIAPTGVLSIIGNINQQNMLVVHDLEKETMSITPTQCDHV